MRRLYSALSPAGRPEPSALAAAIDAPHEWEAESAGTFVLRVLGVETVDVVFFWQEDTLFIHHPKKIFRVSPPPQGILRFSMEAWKTPELCMGAATVSLPGPQEDWAWVNRMGEKIDLLEHDKKTFQKLGKDLYSLPRFVVGGQEKIYINLPFGLVAGLEEKEGRLAWSLAKEGDNSFMLLAKGEKNLYKGVSIDFQLEEMLKKDLEVVVADQVVERQGRFSAEQKKCDGA